MLKKVRTTVAISAAALLTAAMLAGCNEGPMTFGPHQPPPQREPSTRPVAANQGQAPYLAVSAPDADGSPTLLTAESASELALKWSKQCMETKEKLATSEQEKRILQESEQKLKADLNEALTQLKDAQNQLKEANAMLQDMKSDLEKWKASVMGFRQEIRDAQAAQMSALTRIVKLLNGEMPPAANAAATAASPSTQPAEPTAATHAGGKEKS